MWEATPTSDVSVAMPGNSQWTRFGIANYPASESRWGKMVQLRGLPAA
jgi:hypothetical protein